MKFTDPFISPVSRVLFSNVVQCACSRSAGTGSHVHTDPNAETGQAFSSSNSSRSSSQERKEQTIKDNLDNTPEFNAVKNAFERLGVDESIDDLPPLQKDAFDRNPDNWSRTLARVDDPRVQDVVSHIGEPNFQNYLDDLLTTRYPGR